MTLGSAYPNEEIESSALDIKGRNMADGLPKNVTITGPEVREALEEPLGYIVDAIKNTLKNTARISGGHYRQWNYANRRRCPDSRFRPFNYARNRYARSCC